MNLTIFGSTGRTGRELVKQALAAGHEVTAFARDASKLTLEHDRLAVVEGTMHQPEQIDAAVAGADAVLSALGPTSNKPGKPLTEGMGHIVAAMKRHGVSRLIAATGAGVQDPNDDPQLIGKFFGLLLRLTAKNVLADSEGMVAAIRNSGLDWTLARAPRLNDKPGTGQLTVGYAGKGPGTQLSRADFASFMLEQIDDNTWSRKAPMISN